MPQPIAVAGKAGGSRSAAAPAPPPATGHAARAGDAVVQRDGVLREPWKLEPEIRVYQVDAGAGPRLDAAPQHAVEVGRLERMALVGATRAHAEGLERARVDERVDRPLDARPVEPVEPVEPVSPATGSSVVVHPNRSAANSTGTIKTVKRPRCSSFRFQSLFPFILVSPFSVKMTKQRFGRRTYIKTPGDLSTFRPHQPLY